MKPKVIMKTDGELGVRINMSKYSHSLEMMINGVQWSGAPINPLLARMMIQVLENYLVKNEG